MTFNDFISKVQSKVSDPSFGLSNNQTDIENYLDEMITMLKIKMKVYDEVPSFDLTNPTTNYTNIPDHVLTTYSVQYLAYLYYESQSDIENMQIFLSNASQALDTNIGSLTYDEKTKSIVVYKQDKKGWNYGF